MAKIPGPLENDADDVSLALEVAQSQWKRGDQVEALKWLRRAVTAAFDVDDDQRGMELSKIAADMKAEMDNQPQAQRPPPPMGAVPMPPSPPSAGRLPPKNKPPTPFHPFDDGKSAISSVDDLPPDDDEATRKFRVGDYGDFEASNEGIVDFWPKDNLDDIEVMTEPPAPSPGPLPNTKPQQLKAQPPKAKKPTKVLAGEGTMARKKQETAVPWTRAVRVAVGKDQSSVYVRLLDTQGLRRGEHHAMLVALTSDSDIRSFFK